MTRPLPPLLPRISDYATWQANQQPDAIAMKLDGVATTYATLAAQVEGLARALLAAGVTKGDRVASLLPPHPQFLVDFLATASIGAIWVGLNPRYQLDELRHVVTDAEPRVLLGRQRIGERRYETELMALTASCPTVTHLVLHDADGPMPGAVSIADFLAAGEGVTDAPLIRARDGCGGRDPCLIVYTSGSTGRPKGALLHHEGLARFSLGQNRLWPLDPLRVINYFPINHVGCVADCTLPCLVAGGTLVFMEKFDTGECLRLMQAERITLWGSVPSTFPMLLDHPDFARTDLSCVELIVWGGAAMDAATIARLANVQPRMATNYGMTETTSAVTALGPVTDADLLANCVGHAFEGVEIRLANTDGQPVPDGEPGEVQTRSPLNFLGYWRRPEATAEAFTADGFFRTGDLAVRRPDGRYRIVGRIKEMYKSGGYNVYPREVEAVLLACPGVTEAAIVAIPDPVWQEVGIAYITLSTPMDLTAMQAFLRDRLANYKLPKRIIPLDAMPLLPIGKIDKAALKQQALTMSASG
ncbi:class I adenylate-forming enzyme family protein [Niveispirillum sp.]|uniref:class I adenylate-forming enzyme family protein n=1 Tax=Niveispirillum sp. TaxID=1917217 RepID=UPI001B3F494E|nr:class I adenylate-forming enzyme family protein [Niveispirillum sp.]MBP7335199.1 acyl--CoA ligase [Niveispirillum sp.]